MKREKLLKAIMGEESFDTLRKALDKLSTSSVVDIGELYHSLKVAPKAVMAFLTKELKDFKDAKEIDLPWAENTRMLVNKLANDVYQGHIIEDGKITHDFRLTSMPALAAHLTSHFELYDEDKKEESSKEQSKEDSKHSSRIDELERKINSLQLQLLESKINTLMASVSNRKPEHIEKAEPEKIEKAGTMPVMPHPPTAGSNIGGNQGKAKTGLLGSKTGATDRLSRPVKALGKPMLGGGKAPSAALSGVMAKPAVAKTMTFDKSETMNECLDCHKPEFDKHGHYVGCDCFRSFSKPKIKKSEGNSVTLEFDHDWDQDAVIALIRTVKQYGRD